MKATEFRVGNVFKDKEGNILTCLGITDESNENKGIVWYGKELGFYLDLDECTAIPLTEQWLIDSFGAKLFPWGFVLNDILIRWSKKKDSCTYWIELGNGKTINLPYVHSLQNFFSLIGTELTLNQEK